MSETENWIFGKKKEKCEEISNKRPDLPVSDNDPHKIFYCALSTIQQKVERKEEKNKEIFALFN